MGCLNLVMEIITMLQNGNINGNNIILYYNFFEHVCTAEWENKTKIRISSCVYNKYYGIF